MEDKLQLDQRIYLPYMTRLQAREAARDDTILLVPVATIEQHGDHAPLHTDIDNCLAVCAATARLVDPEPRCVVAAPVWWSVSPFDPAEFPGTIHMREEIFKESLGDVVECYLFGGFRKIVLVNGHGGSTEWMIPEVVRRLNQRQSRLRPEQGLPAGTRVVTFMWTALLEVFAQEEFMAARGNPEGCADWHGGDVETGVQLYLRPELVDMSQARPGLKLKPLEFAPWDIGHSWYWQYIIAGYPSRVEQPGEMERITGDPTRATAEIGRRVVELAAEVMGRFVREFAAV
ncbi:MAG: creatininase family protein [Armatimonadetes bacterium]|nr:creatininase family protein [Armatimonadota bacterium]